MYQMIETWKKKFVEINAYTQFVQFLRILQGSFLYQLNGDREKYVDKNLSQFFQALVRDQEKEQKYARENAEAFAEIQQLRNCLKSVPHRPKNK